MYWLCSCENCACNCACFAILTMCATSNFLAASSTDWLNFILSINSVQSLWLFMRISAIVRLSTSIDIFLWLMKEWNFYLFYFYLYVL